MLGEFSALRTHLPDNIPVLCLYLNLYFENAHFSLLLFFPFPTLLFSSFVLAFTSLLLHTHRQTSASELDTHRQEMSLRNSLQSYLSKRFFLAFCAVLFKDRVRTIAYPNEFSESSIISICCHKTLYIDGEIPGMIRST